MKKSISTIASVALATALLAQTTVRNANGSYYKQCSHFAETKPLWQLAQEQEANQPTGVLQEHEAFDESRTKRIQSTNSTLATEIDPVIQTAMGTTQSAGPIANFDGQGSMQGLIPLDPTGAAGPNHYVQMVQSNYRVYDKSGTPLIASLKLSTIFTGSSDNGDGLVMYDKFADRWVLTEYQCSGNCKTLLIAVSKTADPTGAYYTYSFTPDPADFADYPKFSIWSDGYYQTCNCDNPKVTVYERDKMLAGDNSAGFIVIPSTVTQPSSGALFCPLTLFADGQLPPSGSSQYMFYFTDNNWGSSYTDKIEIKELTVNWTDKTGAMYDAASLSPQAFNSKFSGGAVGAIPQPGTSVKLDPTEGFISFRIPYIRWNGYNSAVFAHAVDTGGLVAGIRWYELRQDATTDIWSIYQQGTYAPADGLNRWNPGIGMDMNGNIALAYSVSSASVNPGMRYTGRTACDSPGTMSLTETVGVAGTSSQTSSLRWGDYCHTALDPDGVTFWHTNMYRGSSSKAMSRVFSFQIASCVSGTNNYTAIHAALHVQQVESSLHINATNLPSNETIEVGIYNLNGQLLSAKTIQPVNANAETTMNIFGFAKGIYYVRVINNNFQRTVKVNVQ